MPIPKTQHDILADVQQYEYVQRYCGMLPSKFASFWDPEARDALITAGLIEKGKVWQPCGSKLKGYRLTSAGRELMARLRNGPDGDPDGDLIVQDIPGLEGNQFSLEDLSLLRDVAHFAHISRNNGIAPKDELLDAYDKRDVKRLYELGLLLYVKLKGIEGKKRKGYVLSSVGRRVLDRFGAE